MSYSRHHPMFPWAYSTREDCIHIIEDVKSNDTEALNILGWLLLHTDMVELLLSALRQNTSINRITFNPLENWCQFRNLTRILEAMPQTNVNDIRIWGRSNQKKYCATNIASRMNSIPSLISANFSDCNIGSNAAICISQFLATNTTLKSLYLHRNDIREEGVLALAHMLKEENRTLEVLTLDENPLTANGLRALRDATYNDSSFAEMENSNHSLHSFFHTAKPTLLFHLGPGVWRDLMLSLGANGTSKSPKQAISKKLKRMLQKKHGVQLRVESFVDETTAVKLHILGWISRMCDWDTMYSFKPLMISLVGGN